MLCTPFSADNFHLNEQTSKNFKIKRISVLDTMKHLEQSNKSSKGAIEFMSVLDYWRHLNLLRVGLELAPSLRICNS